MFINCHTCYSLKYGLLSPKELVTAAQKLGVRSLALTDINNTSCAYQFVDACRAQGIKPVLGVEFREENELLYVGIAKNDEGWRELCEWLTRHSLAGEPLPKIAPDWQHCYVIYRKLPKGVQHLNANEFVGVRPEEVNHLYASYMKNHQDRLVVFSPVTFMDNDGFRAHKLLRCIDLNIVVSKLTLKDHAKASEVFYEEAHLEAIFEQYPTIVENTRALLDNCHTEMTSTNLHNRQTFTGNKQDDMKLLTKLSLSGCERRYGPTNRKALLRTQKELKVIEQLGFCAYFLITWDIVRYAHSVGYHHVGRGSGANSIVAYNLLITDVDPLELDLYFERFINPYRSSPPDFDIDFSWDERDDVTDYIFKRYGKEHTALLATYNTFKGRSIIRELGKVLGLPPADIDVIVNEPLASDKHHPFAKHIFRFGKMIEGLPNYLSIHAGGILISERPLNYHTALLLMPKGFPIVHFDMYGAEDLQFHKYDVLSQRGLGHIKDTVKLVKENQGKAIDIHNVSAIKEDVEVKKQLKSGQCIGCFYIESPAMRGLLTKLSCDTYVHLVAASSIIRPGVAKSGMMREYIQRFHKPDSFIYLHPVFEEHLGETFGVMVYQEDVMKIVHHFAGLDLDESDILRRIMTGKKKNSDTFYNLHRKFFVNCAERGYPEELSQEVWRQVESFSGYSFCKAHSASFAVESFQSLYLKTYFPLEFMTGVINNFGGFYQTEYYVHEARMCGAKIEAPCVNHSRNLTHIYGKTIYLGFIHMANLERKLALTIVAERENKGDFRDLKDFINRVEVSREQLEILIRIGAFRFTGLNKYQLMWEKNAVYNPMITHIPVASLFEADTEHFDLPMLEEGKYEQAFDEIEILGFPLCSPFALVNADVKPDILAADMRKYYDKTVVMMGYYVTRKDVTTVNRKLMNFGTWLDEEGMFFDTTHFPPSLAQYPFRGKGVYLLKGKIVDDFGFPSMEVVWMDKLPFVKDERY
ncbi:MAG: DNA polymerase III subunit alpha [Saprospiraceae bacterium]|nr:DNA polymerase III subunit alpha [Saprospiraceae bacterium]